MIVKTSRGKFIVKFKFAENVKLDFKKDEFKREVYTRWFERTTECLVKVLKTGAEKSYLQAVGISACNYQDTYDKYTGMNIAMEKAIEGLRPVYGEKVIEELRQKIKETFKFTEKDIAEKEAERATVLAMRKIAKKQRYDSFAHLRKKKEEIPKWSGLDTVPEEEIKEM